MNLPELPKINKKKEADFGLRFRNWWEKHGMNAPYELKDSRGKNYISYREITDKQINVALAASSDKGVLIRISKGTVGAPDYVGLKNSPYWIVVHYPKSFEVISINSFIIEKQKKRKSLTLERAQKISTLTIKL